MGEYCSELTNSNENVQSSAGGDCQQEELSSHKLPTSTNWYMAAAVAAAAANNGANGSPFGIYGSNDDLIHSSAGTNNNSFSFQTKF